MERRKGVVFLVFHAKTLRKMLARKDARIYRGSQQTGKKRATS